MQAGVESERQKNAFEYYYELGINRSYNKVANRFGVSNPAVHAWAKKYQWAERVAERDLEKADEAKGKTTNAIIVEMEANRKIIKQGLSDFVDRLKKGEVKVTRVKDAIDLMRLDKEYIAFIRGLKNGEEMTEDDKAVQFMISFTEDQINEESKDQVVSSS